MYIHIEHLLNGIDVYLILSILPAFCFAELTDLVNKRVI